MTCGVPQGAIKGPGLFCSTWAAADVGDPDLSVWALKGKKMMILTAGRRRPATRWQPADPTGWTSSCRTSLGGGRRRGPSSGRHRDDDEAPHDEGMTDSFQITEVYLQQNLHSEDGSEGVVCVAQNLNTNTELMQQLLFRLLPSGTQTVLTQQPSSSWTLTTDSTLHMQCFICASSSVLCIYVSSLSASRADLLSSLDFMSILITRATQLQHS